ncbi:MAG: M3 family metallopeptidase [Candidatus Symbiothrix sp.]|jgi:peptidyl-dipeptidase Dcp|nr:M3 family metallopeptidase [Candidatus Symbiothrix sp.]
MKKINIFFLIIFVMSACEKQNPFFEKWDTPYEVPPFEKFTVAGYREAFIKGMKEQETEIEAIVNNPETPSFQNTIVAFDASGTLLNNVAAVFFEHASADGTPDILALESEITPLLTQHGDKIMMNPQLFEKVNYVKENADSSALTPEEAALLKLLHLDFVRRGALLDEAKGLRLKEINEKLSVLENQFGQNLLEETGSYRLVMGDKEDLAGLPENVIALAADRAEKAGMPGKWVFGLDNPSIMPFLLSSSKPEWRKEIFTAYLNRCNNDNTFDNKEILKNIVVLRKEKAAILGYNDFTAYVLDKRMAKNSSNVYELLNQVWTPAIAKAREELAEMQAEGGTDITASDWRYFAEKVKAKKYDFSDEMVRPYFKAENVRDGLFKTFNLLFGITFKEVSDIPKPNKDAQAFVCIDRDGVTELGVLYLDLYARPGLKRGGAWCGTYREAFQNKDGQRVKPITYITCNFTPPIGNEPALLSSDEVETLYHESGHAIHNLFRQVKYHLTSEVPYDFVEFPSQFMEHWAFEPQVLAYYARHYQTGEIIPKVLVDKIQAASKQGQGFATTEYLAASFLDMDYHINSTPENINVPDFEESTLKDKGLIAQIPPRYRSTYFQHIFSGGYAAGYYCYIWSEVLDCDAFESFVEAGDIFNQAIADSYRKNILEPGGIYPADKMYVNFRGRAPLIDALLRKRGFKSN